MIHQQPLRRSSTAVGSMSSTCTSRPPGADSKIELSELRISFASLDAKQHELLGRVGVDAADLRRLRIDSRKITNLVVRASTGNQSGGIEKEHLGGELSARAPIMQDD